VKETIMGHLLAAVGIAAGLLAIPAPATAHHGAATFDTGRELVMDATVMEWVWSNPHCFLKFEGKEPDGTVRQWTVETQSPPDMVNRGWSRRSFKAGDRVTVTVEPVKSGSPVGRLLQVALADGRVLSARGAVATPPREEDASKR
jgi:hypothetical protein